MTVQCEFYCKDKKLVIENDISDETKERVQVKIYDDVNGKYVEKAWCFVDGNELIKAVQNALNW